MKEKILKIQSQLNYAMIEVKKTRSNKQLIYDYLFEAQTEVNKLASGDAGRCVTFCTDETTTSATKCKYCGKEKFEH